MKPYSEMTRKEKADLRYTRAYVDWNATGCGYHTPEFAELEAATEEQTAAIKEEFNL